MIRRIWYHGTHQTIGSANDFRPDRKRGERDLNENGPGLYFSSHQDDAAKYGPTIYQWKAPDGFRLIMGDKKLPMETLWQIVMPSNGTGHSINFLSNFAEPPYSLKQLHTILRDNYSQYTAAETLVLLYHDYFGYDTDEYLKAVRRVADGMLCKRRPPVSHLIVFSVGRSMKMSVVK